MTHTANIMGAKADAKKAQFSMRQFLRLLRVCCRYPRPLLMGMGATVVFAVLHTVSIGTAFPIFKILLEQERVHTWVDRMVAGQRLGVTFAPVTDPKSVLILKVNSDTDAFKRNLRAGCQLVESPGQDVVAVLAELASAPTGQSVPLRVAGIDGVVRDITLAPLDADPPMRALHWVASLVPTTVEDNKLDTLAYIMVALVALVILANTVRYFGEVWVTKAVLLSMMHLRTDLYDRTLHLPMSFFGAQSTSDIVGRFVQDIQEVQRGMMTLFSKFVREPLRLVFLFAFAFRLDWSLTLAVLIAAPIAMLVFWRVGKSVKRSARKLLLAWGEMIGALTASLQNLRVVKAYTAEEHERRRLRDVDVRAMRQQLKLAKLQAFVSPTMETMAVIGASVVMLWLANRILNHDLPIADFGTLGLVLATMFDPLRRLSDVYVRVQRSTSGAERIFQVIDHPIESDICDSNVEIKPLATQIEFCHVTFTYDGAETPALSDINLSIRRGETVALVGPNGCGKTTLVSMLPRLFTPNTGEIRFDGLDIRQATLPSLRGQISLVTQDAVVFAGTPTENIAYGQAVVDDERVKDAARRASADEFIQAIPGGYNAALGERGTTLSGGQRQRLAIARAIYRDAPILIFDEATSQVDSESELKIQTAVREFSQDRTTLIIAHRLSTIQFADRIIVMDAGRILQTGSHADLYEGCPLYRVLCDTQFGEPRPADSE